MPGFNVLDPHLPLYRNHFLEASAGTGKTFTIEHLIVRMLQDPKGPKIHEILVVTFTKAATTELKRRVWQSLEKHGLLEAMRAFDEAQIYTIHGFCFHALQAQALETGFSLDQVEESAAQEVLLRIVKDYLRTEADCLSSKQLEKILRRYQNDIDLLVARLLSLAGRRIPIVGGKPYAALLQDLVNESEKLKQKFSLESSKLEDDLLALTTLFGKFCDRQKNLKPEFAAGLRDVVTFFEKHEGDLIDSPLILMNVDNRLKRAREVSLHYPGLLEAMQERLIPMLTQASDELTIMATLAEGARNFIEGAVEKQDLFFFDDLLKFMQKYVHEPHFASKLRSQYKAVLIDEFQDTDEMQWDIFSTLFLHNEFQGPFYLIGDPKQSIYRFRGADLYTYLKAKKALGPESAAFLDKNFRSDPPLVEALNVLFSSVSPFIFLAKTGEVIDCPPVEPALKESVRNWNDRKGRIHFVHAKEEEELFSFVVEEIKSLQIPLRDCAVLVKDRFQLERFAAFASLPLAAKLSRSLLDSPAYLIWKDFLGAVLQPRDRNKIALALGGPLFRYSLEEIAAGFEERIPLFFHYHHLLKTKGVLALFYAVIEEAFLSEMLYQDLLQLVELTVENTQSPEEALSFLLSLKLEDSESQRLKARAFGDSDAIQVMTIHASKGLEFGVVFPLGLALSTPSKRDFVREENRYVIAESDESEKTRLLYVACTRAKHRLYLPVIKGEKNSAIQLFLGEKETTSFNHPEITTSSCEGMRNATLVTREKDPLEFAELKKQMYIPQVIQSYSSLVHSEKEGVVSLKNENDLPAGADTGILLHKIFEQIDFEKAFRFKTAACLEDVIAPILKNTPLESWLQRTCTLVYQALFAPLQGESSFALADVDPKRIFKEVEFLYPTAEGYMKGFIDLFFEYKGKSYAVDWKSNHLADYSKASLEKAIQAHRYDVQAEIYTTALNRYLNQLSKPPLEGIFYIFLRGVEKNSSQGIVFL